MYELIVIGAGPAGVTAAVYAARKRLNSLVLTKDVGGQAALSGDIENYTGYQFITGIDLAGKFAEHMQTVGMKVIEGCEVECVDKEGESFKVRTADGTYESRTVVIASGRRPRTLGVDGEQQFKNRGVTYCATCDAPLFQAKDVLVVGGGNSALDAALQLIPIAGRIYVVNMADELTGDPVMVEKVMESDKVEILSRHRVSRIYGGDFVEGVEVEAEAGGKKQLDVQGVFVEVGSLPVKEPACKARVNEQGEIVVNKRCETSIPGLFAAGDVTDVPEKQIIVAAGQGCVACLSAFKYLSTNIFDEVKQR
jgi:NADH-dependent peroxiredoxin subunit F